MAEPETSAPVDDAECPASDGWDQLEEQFRLAEEQWHKEQEEERVAAEQRAKRRKEDKKRRESEPTEADKREELLYQLAETGDVDALMPLLDPDPIRGIHDALSRRPSMFFIRKALDALASQAPEKLVEFLGARALAFQGEILLRAQHIAMREISRHDREVGEQCAAIPEEVAQVWLPRIAAIQSAIEQSGATLARSSHAFELARRARNNQKNSPAEEDQNDGVTSKARRSKTTAKKPADSTC